MDYKVVEIDNAIISLLQPLADEAHSQGFLFVQRTIDEWRNGTNTFSNSGEKLWGLLTKDELICIGGLNQDPYTNDPNVGRIRHLYVAKKYRGKGLSKVILRLIIDKVAEHFKTVRLFTDNPIAAGLYESNGFKKREEYKATHFKYM